MNWTIREVAEKYEIDIIDKIEKLGVSNLSVEELIQTFVHKANGASAQTIAASITDNIRLETLSSLTPSSLAKCDGIGRKSAAALLAGIELGQRIATQAVSYAT